MSPFGFKVADAGCAQADNSKILSAIGQEHAVEGRGESDVVLPSRYAHLEVGEDALKYPLPFDEVKPADYEKWVGPTPDFNDLRTRSAARVANEPEFRFLQQDIDKMEARIASNKLSLNKDEREAEIAAGKKHLDEIKKERLERKQTPPVEYSLALSDVDKAKLDRINVDKKDKKDKDKAAQQKADAANADAASDDADDDLDGGLGTAKANVIDPIKTESLNILEDLIEQSRHVKLAKTRD